MIAWKPGLEVDLSPKKIMGVSSLHPCNGYFRVQVFSYLPLSRQEAETDNFAKANPVDVAELRARINEVVPTKDGSH